MALQRQILRTKPEPWSQEERALEVIWRDDQIVWAGPPGASPYPDNLVATRVLDVNVSVAELQRIKSAYSIDDAATEPDQSV